MSDAPPHVVRGFDPDWQPKLQAVVQAFRSIDDGGRTSAHYSKVPGRGSLLAGSQWVREWAPQAHTIRVRRVHPGRWHDCQYGPLHRDGAFGPDGITYVLALNGLGGPYPGIMFWDDRGGSSVPELQAGDLLSFGSDVWHQRWIGDAKWPRYALEWRAPQ